MARGPIIVFDRLPPDDGENWLAILKSDNDRMWSVELTNFRRGGRKQKGTLSIWRLRFLVMAIRNRHPSAVKSKKGTEPIVFRTRRAGHVVAVVSCLPGPVASIATKH
jgi:hypothetical protein